MDLRAYRALRDAAATWAEIARETGHDWRTLKKYLSSDAGDRPPAVITRRPTEKKLIDPYTDLIDARLKSERRAPGGRPRLRRLLPAAEALRGRGPGAAVARAPRAPPPLRGALRGPGPGRLGRRGLCRLPRGPGARLELPHDAVLQPGPLRLLRHLPGPGQLLGLPPPGVRPLRGRARHHRLRPHPRRWCAPKCGATRRCPCTPRR